MTRPLGKTVNLSEAALLGIPKLTLPESTRFDRDYVSLSLRSFLIHDDSLHPVGRTTAHAHAATLGRVICLCVHRGNLAATMIYAAIVSPRRPFSCASSFEADPFRRNALMRAPPR